MNNKAFTLIELLVVISIIGVISSVIFVSFSGSRDKARLARAQQFDAQISHVLGAYAVGIWRFEEGNGTIARDESGLGNNGTLHSSGSVCFNGTCPTWVAGAYPETGALKFDGSNDYIDGGNKSSLNITDAITIAAWVKFNFLDYTGGTGGLQGIAGKGQPDRIPSNYGWWFSYDNRNNRKSFVYTCFGNSTGGYAGGTNNFNGYNYTFSTEHWYHIAITVAQTKAKLYISGKQLGRTKTIQNLQLSDNTRNLTIGGLMGDSYTFNGLIDNVSIYNEALSSAQIQQHFVASAPAHGIAVK